MISETESARIPGFEVLEEVGRGAETVVYKARRRDRLVALKLLRRLPAGHDPETVRRFRREASILARMRHPAAAKVLEVGEHEDRPYLVTEFLEGRTLASMLAERRLTEPEILRLAKTIVEVLEELHRLGLVHRDVKPANILLGHDGEARLLDFGLAIQASHAFDRESGRTIAGSVRYSPPEQTGLLRRPVDGRSDLYTVGTVLFECAAGRPPFLSDDAAELIRLHAVATPPDLRSLSPGISPAFAAIVHKLLAKDPDDRYQSALGLLKDLEQLSTLNQQLQAGRPIQLDAGTTESATLDQTLIVGRSAELERLNAAWEAARAGQGTAVLIVGEAGSGKSRLVRELLRLLPGNPLVLTGKCSDADVTPLGPFQRAIDGHLDAIARLPDAERSQLEARLVAAVGNLAPLLKRLSPGLARLFRQTPDATEFEGIQDRFYDAVAELFCQLAYSRPAVLFLDDLQWIDESSRRVLRRLAGRLAASSLLFIGTTRPEHLDGTAPARLVADLERARPQLIELGALDEEAVTSLIMDYLGGQAVDPDFVERIVRRSHGNPLAVGEYVRSMLDGGYLRPNWGTWAVDHAGFDQLALPADIAELVVRRVGLLSETTRQVLVAAAIIGVDIRPELLATVGEASADSVRQALEEALQTQLIEHSGHGAYSFVHDRVREALLGGVAPAERRRLHQRVANALEAGDADVYQLATHYARGEVESHWPRVYETSLAAGKLARDNFADEQAIEYLSMASRAVHEGGLPEDATLEQLLGEVCSRTGRVEEAVGHFERALVLTNDSVSRVELYAELAGIHLTTHHTQRAWKAIDAALREAGEPPLRAGPIELFRTLWNWLGFALGERLRPLAPGPATVQRDVRSALTRIYWLAAEAAFIDDASPIIQLGCTMRALRLARQIGRSPQLAAAYAFYASVLAVMGRHGASVHYVERAVQLAEEIGDRPTLARVWSMQGVAAHFRGESRAAEEYHRRTLARAEPWLPAQEYRDTVGDLIVNLKLRGYAREVIGLAERSDARIFSGNERGVWTGLGWFLGIHCAPTLAALGQPAAGLEYLRRGRALVEPTPEARSSWNNYLANELQFLLEQGETGPAVDEAIVAAERLHMRAGHPLIQFTYFHVPLTYLRLGQYLAASPADRPLRRRQFMAALRQLRAASHPAIRCHALALAGAAARLDGHLGLAERRLSEAEAFANEVDSPWALYEIARQRAYLALERENQPAALRQAQFAFDLAIRNGWVNRARWIAAEFQVDARSSYSSELHASGSSHQTLRLQRQLDALLQVSLSAATFRDPQAQARVALDELIRILGAERGFVLLCREDGSLELGAGRDAEGRDLPELVAYSRTVVDTVRAAQQPLIVNSTEQDIITATQSIVAHDLRSIIAAPLLLHDRLIGVIYLDNRLARGVFGDDDLAILQAVATQVAIAIETARAFAEQATLNEEITRLLRVVESQVEAIERARQQVSAAEERQRREIAEFLHARVQGKLLIAWHQLGEVEALCRTDPARASERLAAIRAELDRLREQDIRQVSHSLHPSYIGMGLLPALRSLAGWHAGRLDIRIHAADEVARLDDLLNNQLPEPLRLVAYRVVEEALNNVLRHAEATTVDVSLALSEDGDLLITIRDDGRGFDPATSQPGLGLSSIAGRVEQVGGTWQIESQPGAGTTVRIRLPLKRADH